MYGSSGSSDTISTFRHKTMILIRAKSFKRQIKCSHWLSACRPRPPCQARQYVPYPGPRIPSPDGSGCSKSSSSSTDEQEWNVTWYPDFRNWLSFQSCKQKTRQGEFFFKSQTTPCHYLKKKTKHLSLDLIVYIKSQQNTAATLIL